MYTKIGSDGIAVTVLTPVEVQGLITRMSPVVLARPSGAVEKEIASLAALFLAVERGADDSLTPSVYHISARTHRAYGQTADGRYVMLDPVVGDLVAIRPAVQRRVAVRFEVLAAQPSEVR